MSLLLANFFGSFASSQMHCAALFVALRDKLCPFWTVNLATKYQQQRSILNKACGSMLDSEFCRVL
jgi:hypothetical protein